MKNPSNYSITSELKKRVPMLIALLILAGTIWLNLSGIGRKQTWDVELPMANAHVSWQQTHHAGAWE